MKTLQDNKLFGKVNLDLRRSIVETSLNLS